MAAPEPPPEPSADADADADAASHGDGDAPLAPAARRPGPPRGFEILLVILVAAALLLPGIWRYSLVDPWETHYGEVARRMKQDQDWVHLNWQNEGFRSKPVLTFWLMASSMTALGIGDHGGYSGEMAESPRVVLAIRLPFVLLAIAGLCVVWWALARLVSRRLAWLALLTIGTCPFFFLVARQGITDMTLVALVMAVLALFLLAAEDGEGPTRPLGRVPLPPGLGHLLAELFPSAVQVGATRRLGRLALYRRRWLSWDARWPLAIVIGGFLAVQAVYYFVYFQLQPNAHPVVLRNAWPQPGWILLAIITFGLCYVFTPRVFFYGRALVIWPFVGRWRRAEELAAPSLPSYALGAFFRTGDWGWAWLVGSIAAGLSTLLVVRGIAPGGPVLRLSTLGGLPIYGHAALVWLVVAGLTAFALGAHHHPLPGWREAHARARRYTDLRPLAAHRGSIYVLWFWALVGISVLGKGLPGLGIAGVVCATGVVFQVRWRQLLDGAFELKRGVVLLVITVVPWHVAMWLRDGRKFISEWIFFHNLNRAGVGVHGDRGTFVYVLEQAGYGLFLWAALVPLALAAAALVRRPDARADRVRVFIALWAVVATALFSMSQTKFHHYILPAVPAVAILVAFWLDDLLARRIRPSLVYGALAAGMVLLLARDMMHEEKQWIEMFIYRYDRAWPSAPPWSIDTSDAFLAMGLCGAAAMLLLGTRWRRLAVAAVMTTAIGCALWAMHVYMPIAGTHWGMRDAVRRYYQERQIYGAKVVYYTPTQFRADWLRLRTGWTFDTFVPDAYQDGQPMAVSVEVQGAARDLRLVVRGRSRAVGPHSIRIDLDPGELARAWRTALDTPAGGRPSRRPTRVVDADRLIAWQLYWRGENFWSGDEIWGVLPEMQTALKETDNVAFKRYLGDRTLAPEGRRYFIVTEASRTGSLSTLLPTETARQTVKVIDTTSNKFSLAVFQL
jgi:4-amino-4-deoxy-L-arabinose transferase-like glycosyltransferase